MGMAGFPVSGQFEALYAGQLRAATCYLRHAKGHGHCVMVMGFGETWLTLGIEPRSH